MVTVSIESTNHFTHTKNFFCAVRKAYRLRALATHPDKLDPNAPDILKHAAEGRFRQVSYAHIIEPDGASLNNI
jgi:hypothetical protein